MVDQIGEFRIRGVLGEGGGGIVYDAVSPSGVVALKVPHPDRELTDRDRSRYLAEAAMMARVEHPAIVEVLASGVLPDGRPFVAMPQLDGCTVAERVSQAGPFEMKTALRLIDQLADATMALHAEDLLHRDLKCDNVFLIGDDEAVKLLDFGIAKDRSQPVRHTTTGMVRGTPATMAPERFFGTDASEQSDVYELAVVFYVMVVGRLPWEGLETDVAARANPMPPHVARPGLSPAVSEVILGALATRPEQRPATPRAFADALQHAASEPFANFSPVAFNATVTSESLRPVLRDYQTPFDAAVASRPDGRVTDAPARRGGWVFIGAAAALMLGLGVRAMSPAPAQTSSALGSVATNHSLKVMSALEEVARTTAQQAVEPDAANAAEPDAAEPDAAEPDAAEPDAAEPDVDEPPVEPASARPTPKSVTRPAAPPKATATALQPEQIPGGVHETSPY
jgi:eukaryotic-like serine/threonine-protein kinase